MVKGLIALLLAGQEAGAAAPGPVEVEIAVNGNGDVAAQGYRVAAFFSSTEGTPEEASAKVKAAKAAAIVAVRPLAPVDRATCAPDPAKIGLVGNEAVGGPDPQDVSGTFEPPQFEAYEIVLPNRHAAELAQLAIRQAGGRNVQGPTAVLFDCAAGTQLAQADALTQARVQAEPYARLLGMRVAGIRRISQASGQNFMEIYAAVVAGASAKLDPDKVRVSVPVTVTFMLEK